MHIEIWSVGKENESFIAEGVAHYFQKIKPWNSIELVILPPSKKITDPEQCKKYEEEMILKRLQPHHFLVVFDERGKELTSVQWAEHLQQCMNQSVKTLVLLIGGAFGVTDSVRKRGQQCRSLSAMVFPHQLVRLIIAEQVYRALSIINHSPYHHV